MVCNNAVECFFWNLLCVCISKNIFFWYRSVRAFFKIYSHRFNRKMKAFFLCIGVNIEKTRKKKKYSRRNKSKESSYECEAGFFFVCFGKMFYSQLIHIEYVWAWKLLSIDVKGQVSFILFSHNFSCYILCSTLFPSIFHFVFFLSLCLVVGVLWISRMSWAKMQTQNKVA